MKFIKCLRKHLHSDFIGISLNAGKDIEFYAVSDILQYKKDLFKYKVIYISAVNSKSAIVRHYEPVVVYYLVI